MIYSSSSKIGFRKKSLFMTKLQKVVRLESSLNKEDPQKVLDDLSEIVPYNENNGSPGELYNVLNFKFNILSNFDTESSLEDDLDDLDPDNSDDADIIKCDKKQIHWLDDHVVDFVNIYDVAKPISKQQVKNILKCFEKKFNKLSV